VSPNARKRADAVANRQRASAAAAARQRRNRWLIWGGFAVVVLIAVLVAVVSSGGNDGTSSANTTKFETHAVTVTGTPLPKYDSTKYSGNGSDPAIGETIPTATGVSVFDGTPVTIKPNGKPQMLVFVAHWCPHCQAEVPELVKLAKQGVFDGVDVTAVATGTNPGYPNYPPSAWLKKEGWPFPVMADTPQGAAANAYGLSAYPYFVLVDASGNVVGRATGEVPAANIKANIQALKAGSPLPLLSSGASSSS
jgi:cytochrome c biogenesis protein CcmG, thiol:disulfide interchange protein DsbE